MSHYARKTDSNQAAIVEVLRRIGWLVLDNSKAGQGCPDLIAWHPTRRVLRLVEVKNKQGRNRATPAQDALTERGWPIVTVRSVDEAVRL